MKIYQIVTQHLLLIDERGVIREIAIFFFLHIIKFVRYGSGNEYNNVQNILKLSLLWQGENYAT